MTLRAHQADDPSALATALKEAERQEDAPAAERAGHALLDAGQWRDVVAYATRTTERAAGAEELSSLRRFHGR